MKAETLFKTWSIIRIISIISCLGYIAFYIVYNVVVGITDQFLIELQTTMFTGGLTMLIISIAIRSEIYNKKRQKEKEDLDKYLQEHPEERIKDVKASLELKDAEQQQ